MLGWGSVAFLRDVGVAGVDELHAHLAERAFGPEFLLVEVTEHQHFLAFVDKVLYLAEVFVAVNFELCVPVD